MRIGPVAARRSPALKLAANCLTLQTQPSTSNREQLIESNLKYHSE